MPSIRAPATKRTTTLTVAVKCRRLTDRERGRDIIRVNNDKEVLVMDPDLSKDYLERIQNRTKDRRYSFDYAFGHESTNSDVYKRSISATVAGVIQGLNATIFAYGSTGSGKTYTMVGTQNDPGLMVLSLHTIFDLIGKDSSSDDVQVTCSYLEVYNEVIYDLLEKSSGHLELREDPQHGIIVPGLRCIKVNSADKILELLNLGNSRRKTESTEANETSSRSHAVLEIAVTKKQKNRYRNQVIRGKLALVDLAGSERASETKSGGQKLRDGANINRSLLALANCINALGKQQKKGLAYVPYRNSKLTRILKDGLSGNSQTIMIATISPADSQYHHTINTLKYADRAKEIKTHIQKNIGTVDTHVADYQRMIDSLQVEVCRLKKELAEKESQATSKPTENASDDELSWLNILSQETSENVQERINLQKALFELEETNLRNRTELKHLDDSIARHQELLKSFNNLIVLAPTLEAIENDGAIVHVLVSRRQVILDNIRDNDEADANYKKDIETNEKHRCQLQGMIEEAISNNGNRTYLRILSQYRLLGMANTELQFEMAMRDQIIHNQQEVQRNMWNLLLGLGLDEKRISEIAAKQGILIEDWTTPGSVRSDNKQSQNIGAGSTSSHLSYSPFSAQSFANSSHIFQNNLNVGSRSSFKGSWNLLHTFSREVHHSSYYYTTQENYLSAPVRQSKRNEHSLDDEGTTSGFSLPDKSPQAFQELYQKYMRTLSSLYSETPVQTSPCSSDFQQQQKELWTSVPRQKSHESSSGSTASPSQLSGGLRMHQGQTIHQGQSRYSPTEQVPTILESNHFPSLAPPNHPNMSQVLPLFARSRSIHLKSYSLDTHPSHFV